MRSVNRFFCMRVYAFCTLLQWNPPLGAAEMDIVTSVLVLLCKMKCMFFSLPVEAAESTARLISTALG